MREPYSPLIERLTELEMVQLVRRGTEPELTYLFKHALTQETVYRSLLKITRADLHRRVADVIEQLWPEQMDQNAEILHMHYERAGMNDKAFHYAVIAADRAAHSFAYVEALTFYDRALSLASHLVESEDKRTLTGAIRPVYVKKGRVFEVVGNHPAAVETYRAMIGFARQTGDTAMEADGLNHLVTAQVVLTGSSTETDQQLERARALAQSIRDPELEARALWNRGLAYRLVDPKRAADDFAVALELTKAENLSQLAAYVKMDLSLALVNLGHARRAWDYLQQALAEFRALDLKPMISDALGSMAYHAYMRGDPIAARAYTEEGQTISETIGNPWGALYNEMFRVFILEQESGRLERIFLESESYLGRARQPGYPYFTVMIHSVLAMASLQLNQPTQARRWADEAAKECGIDIETPLARWARWLHASVLISRRELASAHALLAPLMESERLALGPLDFSGWLGQTLAQLALYESRLEDGLELCNRFIQRFERQEQWGFAAGMYYWRAMIQYARQDLTHAGQDALQAVELLERAENRILLWRAEALLANVYERQGNHMAALNLRKRAGVIIKYIAEHSPGELREPYLLSPEVQSVISS